MFAVKGMGGHRRPPATFRNPARPRRAGRCALAVLLTAATVGWIGEGNTSAAGPAELISVDPNTNGPMGTWDSVPSVSGDGNLVVFSSTPAPGVEFGGNQWVYVRNRSAGTTTAVPLPAPFWDAATGGVVSRDGCHVAFWGHQIQILFFSAAQWDIYSWDRCSAAGSLALINASDLPNLTNFGDTIGPLSISADGRYVAYTAQQSGGAPRIARIDTSTATEARMPGTVISASSIDVSDNGALVAVGVRANIQPLTRDLVVGWDPACNPRITKCTAVYAISVSAAGFPAGGDSTGPSVSADGRYVAFSSNAADIVGLPGSPTAQVYVRDLVASVNVLITDTPGNAMDGRVEDPEISPDGSQIALQRRASDGAPVAGDIAEVYVARSTSGYFNTAVFDLVSYGVSGAPTSLDSSQPSMSSNGRYVAFASFANDELSGVGMPFDLNVWMRERPIALDITPTLDFGTIDVGGTSAPQNAVITNTSQIAINIGAVTPPDAPFSVTANGCTGTLAPGQTCAVTIVFSPAAGGSASSSLTVSGDGLSVSASLVGNGRSPNVPTPGFLTIAPASANYGNAAIGAVLPAKQFTVSNPGQTPVTIVGVGLGGSGADQFIVGANTCTGSLAGGASCTVDVAATVTRTGSQSATLGIAGSGGQSAQTTLRIRGSAELLTPELLMNPGVVSAGEVTAAVGTGFPRLVDVKLAFRDEVPFATVHTDENGAFRYNFLILRNGIRIGGREVVAMDQAQFSGVSAPLLIDLATFRPAGFSSPAFTSGVRSMVSRGG